MLATLCLCTKNSIFLCGFLCLKTAVEKLPSSDSTLWVLVDRLVVMPNYAQAAIQIRQKKEREAKERGREQEIQRKKTKRRRRETETERQRDRETEGWG